MSVTQYLYPGTFYFGNFSAHRIGFEIRQVSNIRTSGCNDVIYRVGELCVRDEIF